MKPDESLDIIARMVSDTRRSVLRQSYIPFIVWGVTTVAVSILVYFLCLAQYRYCHFYWFLIPLIGYPAVIVMHPRTRLIQTGMSASLKSIWLMLAILLVSFSIASFFVRFNVLFFILMLLSIGSFVSGAIISYRFLKYSSIPGFIACVVLLLVSGVVQIPIFAAAIAVMMIVPGIKMKQDLKNI